MRESVFLLAAGMALWGCGDSPTEPDWTELLERTTAERAAWEAARPDGYTMVQRHDCFCPPELLRPALVTVSNEVVQGATWQDDQTPVTGEDLEVFVSVSELFALIENAVSVDAADIDVTFHAQLHYPTFVHIDYAARTADDDRFIWSSDLAETP